MATKNTVDNSLVDAYQKLVDERNRIQAETARKNNLPFTPTTVKRDIPTTRESGELTSRGEFIQTQLNPTLGVNQDYDEYVARARERGNAFLGLERFKQERNRRQTEDEMRRDQLELGRDRPSGQNLTQTQQKAQPTLQSVQRQSKLDAMRDMFNKAFESQKSEIESTREGLTPRFRTERSNIGTADTMARARTEAIQAGQGLSGAGAASQSDIAQNVITQGALGQSRATEAEQNRLLDQAILQAAQQRDLGIAQGELQEAQLADERAYQQQLLNQQIAREDQLRREAQAREDLLLGQQRQDTAQAQQRQDFLNTIGRFSADYQAEINRLQTSDDPDKDFKIAVLQQERQNKINQLGLDQQGNVLPRDTTPNITSTSAAIDLWQQLGTANEAVSRALGIPVGTVYTQRATGGSGLSSSTQASLAKWKYDNGLPLTQTESNILGIPAGFQQGQTQQEQFLQQASDIINPVTIDDITADKRSILERLINTPELYSEPNQLRAILEDQGISIQELEAYEDWRDRALADRPFQ